MLVHCMTLIPPPPPPSLAKNFPYAYAFRGQFGGSVRAGNHSRAEIISGPVQGSFRDKLADKFGV